MIKSIAGGKYLCFTYKGDYKYLGDVYDQIFRDYILTKNIILRGEPLFEQYLNDKNKTATKDLLTKVFIPIKWAIFESTKAEIRSISYIDKVSEI